MKRRSAITAMASGCLATAAGWGLWKSTESNPLNGSQGVRRVPIKLRTYYPAMIAPYPPGVHNQVAGKLGSWEGMSISYLVHWVHLFEGGLVARRADTDEIAAVVATLTDTRALERRFGEPASLVKTPSGVRYLASRGDPRFPASSYLLHAYQMLATFAEIGLSTETPLTVADTKYSIADLVADCTANLQLREVSGLEPEWAATALALYLPPAKSWRNRWGERLGFDSLANFLLQRPLEKYSCYGTHMHLALAVLAQAHEKFPILSQGAIRGIGEKYRAMNRTLERTQRPDGSWDGNWMGEGSTRIEEPWVPVQITGHVMECQSLLPPSWQVGAASFRKAIAYLADAIIEADSSRIRTDYCPFSHAGRAVLGWKRTGGAA